MPVSFVDLGHKPMAPTELRRLASRFTARALLDEDARAYRDSGISYLRLDDDEVFERLLSNQALLRLPLVRIGTNVSAGVDERSWKIWLTAD